MGDVHLGAGHPWCFDRVDCQLRHSVLVERDLLPLNEILLQASEFGLTLHGLPLVLLDVLFVLGALQVEKLAVEVLREGRGWSSVYGGLSEGCLHYHLIMAHPPSVYRVPNQWSVASSLIQLIVHAVSLRGRLAWFLGDLLSHLSEVKNFASFLDQLSFLAPVQ